MMPSGFSIGFKIALQTGCVDTEEYLGLSCCTSYDHPNNAVFRVTEVQYQRAPFVLYSL